MGYIPTLLVLLHQVGWGTKTVTRFLDFVNKVRRFGHTRKLFLIVIVVIIVSMRRPVIFRM